MSVEDFRLSLEREKPGKWHDELLSWCKEKVSSSRADMQERYSAWDDAQTRFRSEMVENRDDKVAMQKQEPKRQVIPIVYSQVETFVSFILALFTQREHVFELTPTGEEDEKPAMLAEALLHKDLVDNKFEIVLFQVLLNIARFNIGVLKITWEEEEKEVSVPQPTSPVVVAGVNIAGSGEPEVVTTRERVRAGNRIEVISPYCFFPDTNFPLSEFQRGEFVASERLLTRQDLIDMEYDGEVVGIEHVGRMPVTTEANASMQRRVLRDRSGLDAMSRRNPLDDGTGPIIVTEIVAKLVPSKYELDGAKLGDEQYPVKYKIWYANDNRIIDIERYEYPHGEFCYAVGEFTPDNEELHSPSLADNVGEIQQTSSWLISSHVANIRKVIHNMLIVDPTLIEVQDVIDGKNVIRAKTSASGSDLSRAVHQVSLQDVTTSHMNDARSMTDLAQIITGISDNAMGQFAPGRRSALEARNVNSGAAMRLKLHGVLIFRGMLEPAARQMLANHRSWLDVETAVRVTGVLTDPNTIAQFVNVTAADIAGNYDFTIFDGTLPSERGAQAVALQEFLQFLGANPQAIALLGYDPRKIVREWLLLRGVRNPDRFLLDEVRAMQIQAMIQQNEQNLNGPASGGAQAGPNGPAAGV